MREKGCHRGCRAEGVSEGLSATYPSRVFPPGAPVLKGHCGQKKVFRAGLPLPLSPDLSRVGEGASCLRVHLGWGSGWLPPPAPQGEPAAEEALQALGSHG